MHGSGEHVAEHGDKPFRGRCWRQPAPGTAAVLVSSREHRGHSSDRQGGGTDPRLKIAPEMVRGPIRVRVTAALVGV